MLSFLQHLLRMMLRRTPLKSEDVALDDRIYMHLDPGNQHLQPSPLILVRLLLFSGWVRVGPGCALAVVFRVPLKKKGFQCKPLVLLDPTLNITSSEACPIGAFRACTHSNRYC